MSVEGNDCIRNQTRAAEMSILNGICTLKVTVYFPYRMNFYFYFFTKGKSLYLMQSHSPSAKSQGFANKSFDKHNVKRINDFILFLCARHLDVYLTGNNSNAFYNLMIFKVSFQYDIGQIYLIGHHYPV